MKKILLVLVALVLGAGPASAQVNPVFTTTSTAAVTNTATVIPLTAVSATVSVAQQATTVTTLRAGYGLYIDGEYMTVASSYVSGLQVPVTRGALGTTAKPHVTSSVVVVGPPGAFSTTDPGAGSSSCSATTLNPAQYPVLINVVTGNAWLCRYISGVKMWVGTNSRKITYDSLTVR